jgi:YggT family protein
MEWLVIVRCVLSFIKHNPYQPVIRFIYEITEPIMGPFRRLLPNVGGLDFSPIIVILALELIRDFVLQLIRTI